MIPIRGHIVPAPSPDCAAYAELLPLVTLRLLSNTEDAGVRAHSAACAHCRALIAAYDRLDTALRTGSAHIAEGAPSVGEVVETIEQQEFGTPASAPQATHAQSLRQPRRVFSLLGAVAAVVMVALLAQALFAHAGGSRAGAPAGSGSQQTLPNTGLPQGLSADYSSVAMVSRNDGWLFGSVYSNMNPSAGCSDCGPFIFHYDGSSWHRSPSPTDQIVTAVSMLSSTDGWAVAQGSILHYTGGAWRVAYTYSVPGDTIFLTTIAMISPSEGWVGGDGTASTDNGFLLHYHGGEWLRVALPGASASTNVNAISMLSPDEGWALERLFGDTGTSSRLLHYQNGAWRAVGGTIDATLTGLAAVSSHMVWMVGSVTGTTGGIFQYFDGQIAQIYSPTPNILSAVTMLSPTDGWAVGDGAATLHWDGTSWTKVGLVIHGIALMGVSFASADDGWAEGNSVYSGPGGQAAMLLHYSGGTWSVYPLKIGG
jgi:hypothetical protein